MPDVEVHQSEEQEEAEVNWAVAVMLLIGSPLYVLTWFDVFWAEIALKVYVLTVPFFGYRVLYLEWKSLKRAWLWACVIPMLVLHSGAMCGVVQINKSFPEMDRFPVATYGVLSLLVIGEGLVLGFILDRFRKP